MYSLYSETSAISQFVITKMALREWIFLRKTMVGIFFRVENIVLRKQVDEFAGNIAGKVLFLVWVGV